MDLLVVIVNYKTANHVVKNLNALIPELRALDHNSECWIVDNNSPDNSLEVIRNSLDAHNFHDAVTLIPHDRNGGFGAGNNIAISKALKQENPPDYFYFLNPDAIAKPGTISKLYNYLQENKTCGVTGGPINNPDGTFSGGAFRFPSLLSTLEDSLNISPVSTLLNRKKIIISPPPEEITKVGWVSGASMMTSRPALEKAGIFDEDFFLYFEEVDLCKRITDHGFGINYLPDASVIHIGGAATGVQQENSRLPNYWHHSRRRYYRKYFGTIGLFIHNLITLTLGPIGFLYKKLRGRQDIRPHYLRDILKYNFFNKNS